ncbi:hypothetical protein ACS5PN_08840 [Roseateles sp. NT4]|uniref:hypothetical protein n=1 Tax=Roseateles sp. NT4 TaxID=3453715 RepID=UPI003EEB000F
MTTYVSPYQVTVTSTAGGLAACTYVDGNGVTVPPGVTLTTQTPANADGSLEFDFGETVVGGQNLRLLGAAVKTVGNDPTMQTYNYLYAVREQSEKGDWVDYLTVPWSPNTYTTRGVVLLFAIVDNNGNMVAFVPSADPQTQNDPE